MNVGNHSMNIEISENIFQCFFKTDTHRLIQPRFIRLWVKQYNQPGTKQVVSYHGIWTFAKRYPSYNYTLFDDI